MSKARNANNNANKDPNDCKDSKQPMPCGLTAPVTTATTAKTATTATATAIMTTNADLKTTSTNVKTKETIKPKQEQSEITLQEWVFLVNSYQMGSKSKSKASDYQLPSPRPSKSTVEMGMIPGAYFGSNDQNDANECDDFHEWFPIQTMYGADGCIYSKLQNVALESDEFGLIVNCQLRSYHREAIFLNSCDDNCEDDDQCAYCLNVRARPVSISIVVASTIDGWIGTQGTLPWRLAGEAQYFKRLTTSPTSSHSLPAIVMGRKTWESLPASLKPLAGRFNAVLTRSPESFCKSGASTEGFLQSLKNFGVYGSLVDALNDLIHKKEHTSIYIIGGAQIYKEALQLSASASSYFVNRIYWTKLLCDKATMLNSTIPSLTSGAAEDDAYFDWKPTSDWKQTSTSAIHKEPNLKDPLKRVVSYCYEVYERQEQEKNKAKDMEKPKG